MLNIQALETSDRIEAVHKGRISIRRLRAALQLFKPMVCDEAYLRLDDELKRLSHMFGQARDLDVFQENTFTPAAREMATPGAKALADYMNAKRNKVHVEVVAAVKSERGRLLLFDLIAWIEDGSWRHSGAWLAKKQIGTFVRAALKKRLRKLVRQGEGLADLDPKSRHKLRIRAKKLRYMASFFKGVSTIAVKNNAMTRLLDSLEGLQESLGRIHDEEAKSEFLEAEIKQFSGETSRDMAFSAGVLAGAVRDDSSNLSEANDAYRTMAKTKPF